MNKNTRYMSLIAKKLYRRYYTALVIFFMTYIVMVACAISMYYSMELHKIYILYEIAQVIKALYLLPLLLPVVVGWVMITNLFIRSPLRYLDEVVVAAEKLTDLDKGAVVLSDELKQVQDNMNALREHAMKSAKQVKETEQRKNDLIVYLAHDLKTPLTSVIGYLTLLRDEGQISEDVREKYLSISLEKAEHLEDLINEFFEITRFNLSNITLEYSKVNLTRMLEQLVYEFKPMFKEKNLNCDLKIAPDIMLRFDVNKMQRVFDNLLRNAVNYSFENSTIRIDVKPLERDLSICFSNHGNTIPAEKLERIFEQFFRLDVARSSRSGGAGLGLAIAKEIVELHGGSIIAMSENEMIAFEVRIPIS